MNNWNALVAEAVVDAPPLSSLTQGENIARIIWAMLNISGTMDFGQGWTGPVMKAFERAGLPAPSVSVLCAQKSLMRREPQRWSAHCPDPALIEDVLAGQA